MSTRYTIEPEERTWAVIAHLSGLGAYIIPLGGIIFPIFLILTKSESPVTQALAKQALYLNLLIYLSAIPIFLMFVTIILIPLAWLAGLVMSVLAIALPVIGAIKASDGSYFKYPVVGQWPVADRV
jgi:uncharacterized Tic20 family protein